jgi:CBS domain-containing protein
MRQLGHVTLEHRPITLDQAVGVTEACDRMRDSQAGAVLVIDSSGALVGIVTGRDAICRVLAQRRDPAVTSLAEVMTANPKTMSPDQNTIDALRLMRDGGFRHVPLLKDGRIVGLVSRADFQSLHKQQYQEELDLWADLR